MSNSVRRTRNTYRIRARTRISYVSRAILYRSACPPLGYAECVSLMPRSPFPPSGGETTDIYYCVGPFPSFSSSSSPAPPGSSISSSSVRRRNNLIPYSRGGCRPWRIEWNKIKPRIPRVLWRGSFPIHFGRVRACLHNRELLSFRLVSPTFPLSSFLPSSLVCPASLLAVWFLVIVPLPMIV